MLISVYDPLVYIYNPNPALTFTQPNPIDLVWDAASSSSASPRPVPPRGVARVHPVEYSGENHHQKLLTVQQLLRKKGAHLGVISALDEVMCFVL